MEKIDKSDGRYVAVRENMARLWKYFNPLIGNVMGTAALISGLYYMSGLDPIYGWAHYMGGEARVDHRKFAMDEKAFGVAGWRTWWRKQSLVNFCRKADTSFYELDSQADFIMDEFSGTTFGPVFTALKDAVSVKEAARIVYYNFLDLETRSQEGLEACQDMAMDIYNEGQGLERDVLTIPVKYVKALTEGVAIKAPKKRVGSIIGRIFRKTLGYMDMDKYYHYVMMSDDGNEYAIYVDDSDAIGYVKANKTLVSTRMEAIKRC